MRVTTTGGISRVARLLTRPDLPILSFKAVLDGWDTHALTIVDNLDRLLTFFLVIDFSSPRERDFYPHELLRALEDHTLPRLPRLLQMSIVHFYFSASGWYRSPP
ncbi:hypothetical protein HGRIS_004196 [Hohenbuehelia grisea]|uniref:Uncharacterized protein n=1 Tax=Hohenbuehelia grisea TaxID=104357 RepID=A0ABR3JHS3_9AGAR